MWTQSLDSDSVNTNQSLPTSNCDGDCNDYVVQTSNITSAKNPNHTMIVLEDDVNNGAQQKIERPKYLPSALTVTSTVRNSDSLSNSVSSFDSKGSFDTEFWVVAPIIITETVTSVNISSVVCRNYRYK